jgi:hypothetical protein
MKKLVFGMLAGALVCSTLASCGEKLLSEAEVTAKVSELYNAQAATVGSELDAQCQASFDARVQTEVDKLVADAAAAKAAAEAEAAAAKAAAKKAPAKKK